MKCKIEIEAGTPLELAELITRLAAHVLKADRMMPIKILAEDGAIVAALAIETANAEPAIGPTSSALARQVMAKAFRAVLS